MERRSLAHDREIPATQQTILAQNYAVGGAPEERRPEMNSCFPGPRRRELFPRKWIRRGESRERHKARKERQVAGKAGSEEDSGVLLGLQGAERE